MATITDETLRQITDRLVKEFQPEKIILFGSYAWGTPNPDSDLDLLVVVREGETSPAGQATRAFRCLRGVGVSKDLLVRTVKEMERRSKVPASLEREILDRGRVLYG